MQRVVIVQQPDGTWVKQVVDVDVNVNVGQPPAPVFAPPQPPIVVQQTQPLPPPPTGFKTITGGVLNGDVRWNPVSKQYEWVQLNRPPRTGWRKAMFGI
jgi:hypothetical protein